MKQPILQVEDVNAKFDSLAKLEENNWKEDKPEPIAKKVVKVINRASVRRTYAVYYVQNSAAYAEITHQRHTADFW